MSPSGEKMDDQAMENIPEGDGTTSTATTNGTGEYSFLTHK